MDPDKGGHTHLGKGSNCRPKVLRLRFCYKARKSAGSCRTFTLNLLGAWETGSRQTEDDRMWHWKDLDDVCVINAVE